MLPACERLFLQARSSRGRVGPHGRPGPAPGGDELAGLAWPETLPRGLTWAGLGSPFLWSSQQPGRSFSSFKIPSLCQFQGFASAAPSPQMPLPPDGLLAGPPVIGVISNILSEGPFPDPPPKVAPHPSVALSFSSF